MLKDQCIAEVDIVVEDKRWLAVDLQAIADRAVASVLARLQFDGEDVEVAILACGDPRIIELNADFREKPTSTNVLSWPAAELSSQVAGGFLTAQPPIPWVLLNWATLQSVMIHVHPKRRLRVRPCKTM